MKERSPRIPAVQLLHHVRALVRRFAVSERADVFCCGMTVAQSATLETLRLEGPLRMGDLGRKLGIAPSTLTRNLERLVDAGHVTRETDGSDARAFCIALTPSGRKMADRLERQEEEFAGQILARIASDRRADVVESLGVLLRAVREATESCCPPGAFDHLMTGIPATGPGTPGAEKETRSCDGC